MRRGGQVFAFSVNPENPLQFEDFHSDSDGPDDNGAPEAGAGAYGPLLLGEARGSGGTAASGGGDVAGVKKAGGAGGEGGRRAGSGRGRAARRRLVADDPDAPVVSSDSGSDDGEEDGCDSEASETSDCEAPAARGEGCASGRRAGGGVHAGADDDTDDGDGDEDEESDDGLVAYEMDDGDSEEEEKGVADGEEGDGGTLRIGQGRVALPTTLRQCLAGIRSSNADEVEAAVWALPELAARSPDLAGEICCEMALALLRLEDRIAMDDFVGRRHRGLVALACADPKQVALGLSQAVWYLLLIPAACLVHHII